MDNYEYDDLAYSDYINFTSSELDEFYKNIIEPEIPHIEYLTHVQIGFIHLFLSVSFIIFQLLIFSVCFIIFYILKIDFIEFL